MIDPARLSAFAAMTALTSIVPGPNMLFLLAQASWRGSSPAMRSLAGVQLGNSAWFVLAGLGLGSLLAASSTAYRLLAVSGAVYLAWLGVGAWRNAGAAGAAEAASARTSGRPFRDGVVVALSNPKSLVYVAALLPPFVDPRGAVTPQLVLLAVVAIGLDVVIGAAYILAGSRLATAVTRPATRARLDRITGSVFLALALWVVAGLVS